MSLDLLRIEKTSGDVVRERMKCDINRVLIGKVSWLTPSAYIVFVLCNLTGNCTAKLALW